MFRKLRRKIVRLALVGGAGAAATWFLDPDRGVQRREQAKEKASSLLKRGGGTTTTPDWKASAANGFDTPVTVPAPAPTGGDITGTVPVDLLVVEERVVNQ